MKEYDGRVRLVFKDFPLPSHKLARPDHDRLFAEQPDFQRDDLVRYAAELGLARDAFAACLDERRFAAAVEADVTQARALGVRSTPTFVINGKPLIGAHPVEAFRVAVDEALRSAR
jgi:predicted DsbA family dithiol-disulfide isomerase